jgi:hypothetical protein
MAEEITNKISFDALGSVLLLAFSLGVLQTNSGSALLNGLHHDFLMNVNMF